MKSISVPTELRRKANQSIKERNRFSGVAQRKDIMSRIDKDTCVRGEPPQGQSVRAKALRKTKGILADVGLFKENHLIKDPKHFSLNLLEKHI